MDHSFSNRLLLVPLFNGFSRLDFLDIVEKTPFDFRTFTKDCVILKQNEISRSLFILLSGEVIAHRDSPDHTYQIEEFIQAPAVIQMEYLFGLHNRYTATWKASTEAQFCILDKESVRHLMREYPTFQINYYNAVCTYAQNLSSNQWLRTSKSPEMLFKHFMLSRCYKPIGKKILNIRMEDLAIELGITRLRVSQMLTHLEKEKIIIHTRSKIVMPTLERL